MDLERAETFRNSKLQSFVFTEPHNFKYSEDFRMKILCPMSFTDFPFDKQVCLCAIRSLSDTINQVRMNAPTVIGSENTKIRYNDTPTLEHWSNLPFEVLIKPLESTFEVEDGKNFSTAQVEIQLIRTTDGLFGLVGSYYAPTATFAALSLGSFFIKPEIVRNKCLQKTFQYLSP